jgi:hypothetical protein
MPKCGICSEGAIVRVSLEGIEMDLCQTHWNCEVEYGAIENRDGNGWRMLQNYRESLG